MTARRGWALCFDPEFWDKFGRFDPVPPANGAGVPLALMRGERSRLFRREDAAYLRGFLPPGAPYIEIPDADHHVMIDQPLPFVAALRALLAAWPPAKAG